MNITNLGQDMESNTQELKYIFTRAVGTKDNLYANTMVTAQSFSFVSTKVRNIEEQFI